MTRPRSGPVSRLTYRARRRTVLPGGPARATEHPGRQENERREQLLAAAGELARALLAGQQTQDVLQLIVTRVQQGTTTTLALVGSPTDRDLLSVDAAAGPYADGMRGRSLRLTAEQGGQHLDLGPVPTAALRDTSSLVLPLGGTPEGTRRLLVVLGLPAAGRAAAARALRAFAESATAALELANERVGVERARLLQDRERTAAGLTRLVIPHLFATGLLLTGADGLIFDQPKQARARLRQAVSDLDGAIASVRTAALGLRAATGQAGTAGDPPAPAPDPRGPDRASTDPSGTAPAP